MFSNHLIHIPLAFYSCYYLIASEFFKILVFSLDFLIIIEIIMIMEVDFVTSGILEEELPLEVDENIHVSFILF